METVAIDPARVTARHWLVLAVATFVAASGSAFVVGIGFLLPHLHTDLGMSLPRAGILVAMPSVGMASALIAWGWLVDRSGEKLVLVAGSVGAALALTAALTTDSYPLLSVFLLLAGAATASGNSASGRLVVGWFPAHRRGLAMGIRQMSQPLGAAVAAMSMPLLAQSHGLRAALAVPLVLAVVSAVAALVVVTDPPHPPVPPRPTGQEAPDAADGSPYRESRHLQRIHVVSVLLVLPQGMLQAFLLVWLVLGHGWSAVSAGVVVTVSQVLGAVARIVAGAVSDRIGSRMRPLRGVAISVTAGLAALAAAEALGAPGVVAVTLAVVASVLSVSDNGLAFTAVAEYAGSRWSGRALGVQNTSQFVTISAVTPLVAAVIERVGYWPVFAGAAVVAALAIPLVPGADRRRV
ncbi:MFS transporter [Rhodococcus sp. IEGM 1408]|uniref:MFS transporter n=1 Tax=Rhodococcus sp. IEGM 1408 TaxID=3082220 RepID=UPI0029549883|nr:MFS transporter [Rhodococcus sp. IEGM 1408]MDV8000079.1 MFS transporter [Rhodococcus sp. IEGM 1408]